MSLNSGYVILYYRIYYTLRITGSRSYFIPSQGNAEELVEEEEDNQDGDQHNSCPGNDIEGNAIDTPTHQATIVDQENDEDKQDEQHSGIQVL